MVCLCFLRVGASSDNKLGEPHCFSRFDYEYKVLQKLIQLEEGHKKLEEANEDLAEAIKERDIKIEEQNNEVKALREFVNTTQLQKYESKGKVQNLNPKLLIMVIKSEQEEKLRCIILIVITIIIITIIIIS